LDETLGFWNIARLKDESLVIESPEIPLEPEEKCRFLYAALIENTSGELVSNARFFMDDEKHLRLQIQTSVDGFDAAVLDLARTYAEVVNPENHLSFDSDDLLNLDALLQEPSEEAFLSYDQECALLSSFFSSLEQDTVLKDSLLIEDSGAVGLIELAEDESPVLVVADSLKGLIYLHYPLCILIGGDALEYELITALSVNSMTKLGADLVLGCSDKSPCLYLRGQVADGQFNPETIKDVLGSLLAVGANVNTLLAQSGLISNEYEPLTRKPIGPLV
jgi:hypothetical protein